MTSDLELLGQFAREKSQDAFTELVKRHVNLVHSAALRQVRSPQLAEEIAQSVFADLARGAAKLKPHTIVTAWLYQVTRRTAIDVIRKESRRQLREQIALETNDMNATANDWTQIEPLLDDAMAALDETDRSAILLRYFENKNLREVGAALGTSDDAAQKRVSRAVERLREFFSKRNMTVGTSGLAVLISANAVQSAPIGLALTISTAAALTGTAVSTSTIVAATKTIAMTTLQKTLITTTVAVLAGAGIYAAHQAAQLRDQVQILQQQPEPSVEQISKLQNDLSHASNTIAGLQDDFVKNKKDNSELLKLRGEIGVLRQQQSDLDKLRQIVTRNHLLPTEPEFHLPQINSNNFVETTFSTGPEGMETNNYGHPLRYTMNPSDIQSVSIQGFLNECMEISGWHYLIDRDVVAGSVKFGLTNAVNGAEFVQAFENALMTGTPEFWADGGKTLRKENLVLIHYPYEKTVVVMTQDKAGVWPQQK